ncbi:MAG: hypothetical protein H6718_13205 [Polyangiaceae bacterium]|nr:hypothetical protein [Polyangiaceae bacterium]MCB9607031.1 hypothetical protein [Polyangiaceae bacterium]
MLHRSDPRARTLTRVSVAAAATTLVFAACSGGPQDAQTGSSGTAGTESRGSANGSDASHPGEGGNGGGIGVDAAGDGALTEDSACESRTSEATRRKKPIDIIFVIDNSGTMGGEIEAVQNNINVNFANIMEASDLDYRVIMLSKHGRLWTESVCIEAPLSGIPAGGCTPPPTEPVNSSKFFHYSRGIGSHDSLCKILDTFRRGDEFDLAPNGWEQWLRQDSFKIFVEVSDDGVSCSSSSVGKSFDDHDDIAGGTTVGDKFDLALRTLSPEMFGDPQGERNYQFYSIIGLKGNTPETDPWLPSAPIQDARCTDGSAGPGTGYQQLSIMTGALRYPSCENASFDAIFQAIAQGVVITSKVSCEFAIPAAPEGEAIDLDSIVVGYTPGGGGAEQRYTQVSGADACTSDAFYIEDDHILLCPDACSMVQADDAAKINVLFDCSGTPH